MRIPTRLSTLAMITAMLCLSACFWGRGGGYGGHDHEEQRHDDGGDHRDGEHHDDGEHR